MTNFIKKGNFYFLCGILFRAPLHLVKTFTIKYKNLDGEFEFIKNDKEIFVSI